MVDCVVAFLEAKGAEDAGCAAWETDGGAEERYTEVGHVALRGELLCATGFAYSLSVEKVVLRIKDVAELAGGML